MFFKFLIPLTLWTIYRLLDKDFMKVILPLLLILFTIQACKYTRKKPSSLQSSAASISCTEDLSLDGVESAEKETASAQCRVNACEEDYTKVNVEAILDEITTFCQANESYCQEVFGGAYLPPSLVELTEQYPIACVPDSLPCEGEGITNGERPFVGSKPPTQVEQESLSFSAMYNNETEEPIDYLNQGYGYCQPADENSCAEGYVYTEMVEEYNNVSYPASACVPASQD